MSTPAIDWTRHGTTTPSKYRFVLSFVLHSEIGNLELKNAPIEWKEIQLLLRRDKETHGVYIQAVVNSLTFIKEGKNLLQELYASKGVFSICNLFIYYLDHATRTYVSMPTSYKLDFNTYKLVNLTRSTNGVQINCLEEDMISKFQQRKNTTVDLNKLINIGGQAITPYADMWRNLSLPAINVYKTASFETVGTGNLTGGGTGTLYLYIPLSMLSSEITEAITQTGSADTVRDFDNGILHDNAVEIITGVKGTLYLHLTYITPGIDSLTVRLSVVSSDDSEYDGHNLAYYNSGYTGTKTIAVDESITVPVGKSLAIIITIAYSGAHSYNIGFDDSAVSMYQIFLTAASKLVESWPIYEAIERNLQIILDQQFPLYSEFFGKTTDIYNIADDVYPSENQLHLASIMTGLNIRGAYLVDTMMPVKFTELFKTLRACWAVGGGFETVGGLLVFRIEELAHFYQEVEVLDFTLRVNEIEIDREQYSEAMFAKLKTGYSKYNYEAIMGRGEYNTQNERTTIVPNDNEFDNIAPYRADTRGILELLLKPITVNGTEDVSGDEDIFIVKSQRTGSHYWLAETNENITAYLWSLFHDGSLNLYLTPVRNLIRNGQEINVGLGLVPGTTLAYQTSDKNNKLETTGEGFTIAESDDITTEQLADPLWYPELLTVEIPFYEADYVLLSANPLGYITLSDTLSGWVMDVRWTFAQNLATLKLIRRIIPPLS